MTKYMIRVMAVTVQFFGVFDTAQAAHDHGNKYCQDYRWEVLEIIIVRRSAV